MNSGLLGTCVPNMYTIITMGVTDVITILPSHMITSNLFRKKRVKHHFSKAMENEMWLIA